MRKLLTFVAAGVMALSASAQGYEGNKFFDNWSIGIEGGAVTSWMGSNDIVNTNKAWASKKFLKGARPVFGAELTKQIIPAFGISLQDHAAVNWTDSKTAIDYNDMVLMAKLNVMNFFGGYLGRPRVFEIEAVVGGGWRYYYNKDANYVNNANATVYTPVEGVTYPGEKGEGAALKAGRNSFITKAGLNLLFNLGQKRAWTIAVKPAVIFDMDGFSHQYDNGVRFDKHSANIELTAGVAYHFRGSNGAHHFTTVTPRSQAEIDGLNAQINDLRGQVSDKDAQLDAANRQIADLQNQLNDCRNRKPVVSENTTRLLESAVFFPLSKWVITNSQMPNVERVAIYMKKYPQSTVSIKGYASPSGPLSLNKMLANKRAEVVKNTLIKKYKIDANRIQAKGEGVGHMFSEPEWNRVAISVIDEK